MTGPTIQLLGSGLGHVGSHSYTGTMSAEFDAPPFGFTLDWAAFVAMSSTLIARAPATIVPNRSDFSIVTILRYSLEPGDSTSLHNSPRLTQHTSRFVAKCR